MNFTSQICTSRSQSERLLALGLKKETADMTLQTSLDVCYTTSFQDAIEYFENRHLPPHPTILPAWSLHRLIEMCLNDKTPWMQVKLHNTYDEIISLIEELIRRKGFNKEYLEE